MLLSEKDKARFWSKVNKAGRIVRPELGPCWEWTAGRFSPSGYGQFSYGGKGGRNVLTHRLSYSLARGAMGVGVVVRHACDNRICVRPDHLISGTQADNIADMMNRQRSVHHQCPERLARGEQIGCAKLTEDDVREIRRLHGEGSSCSDLGRRFHVHNSQISRIVRGIYWSHVQCV